MSQMHFGLPQSLENPICYMRYIQNWPSQIQNEPTQKILRTTLYVKGIGAKVVHV